MGIVNKLFLAVLSIAALAAPAAAQFGPPELIEAARKEGKLVFYSANVAESETPAGKLLADVIDHSDRSLMLEIENLFQDYKPPNAEEYIPETRVSEKLWP